MTPRRIFLVLLAAVVAVLDGACSTSPTSGTSFETENTIAGIVVDSSGRPMSGARVALRPFWYVRDSNQADTSMRDGIAEAVSDTQGRFALSGMPLGSYCVQIKGEGLTVLRSESLDVARNRVFLGAVTALTPSHLSGGVAIPPGSGPVKIQVYGTEIQGTSDTNGRYQIAKVPWGELRLRAVSIRTGFVVGEGRVGVPSGSNVVADTLRPGSEDFRTWRHGQNLSIDPVSSGLAGNGVVQDLPVLVRLDHNLFPTQAESNGADLRVCDLSGKPIPFEILLWDSASASGRIWVHLDSLATSGPSRPIRVLWGRKGSTSASSSAAVFDTAAGWSGVWHLSGLVTDKSRTLSPDATANGQSGVVLGTGALGGGVIGRGLQFNGSTDKVRIGGGTTELGRRNFTLEMWVRSDRIGASLLAKGVSFKETGMKEIALRPSKPGDHAAGWYPSLSTYGSFAQYSVAQTPFNLGQWSHLAMRWTVVKTDSGQVDWFMDGQPIGTHRIVLTADAAGDSLSLGQDVAGQVDSLRLKGVLDEVRILRQARTNAWLWLSHAAQAPGSDLVKILDRW